jgi:hypothetical protein
MFLRAICVVVLLGILVAGLWPFHAPRNEVSWLSHGSGVFFGRYGSIVSAAPFKLQSDGACAIEIWLEPTRVHSSGTILAFYRPEDRTVPFALRQSLGDLVLQRASRERLDHVKKVRIYVDDVFSHRKPLQVTISSGQAGTSVYADGAFVRKSSNFRLPSQALTGQLIVGNSPVTTDDWSGQIRGLAIYDRELTASEVSQHFARWASSDPDLTSGDAIALYPFNEGKGNVVHNQIDSATDLLIPERFFVLHEQFLARPWDEYRRDRNYWKDIGINVAGFVPLGVCFVAYLWSVNVKRAVLVTVVMGFTVSLTIEVLQAFLPTRSSGMTDLITNTLGTVLGACFCAWMVRNGWLVRLGIPIRVRIEEGRHSLQPVE